MAGYRHLHALILILSVFPFSADAASADPPMVDGVRLGVHRDFTRVVVDFKGKDAPYSVRISDDGLSVSIIAKATGAGGTLPPKKLGLVRDVQWRSVTNGLVVTVATGTSVVVKSQGALSPDSSNRFYRIYVDLEPGQPPPPIPPDEPPPAVAAEPAAPAEPTMPAETAAATAPPVALVPAPDSNDPKE